MRTEKVWGGFGGEQTALPTKSPFTAPPFREVPFRLIKMLFIAAPFREESIMHAKKEGESGRGRGRKGRRF